MRAAIPATCLAIEFSAAGGPDVVRPVQRPVVLPGPDEILIRVAAAGLNRGDLQQRKGLYPPPPGTTDIPGLEVSGIVAAVGEDASGWAIGQQVCALLAGGGYAEYALAPAGSCLPVPDGMEIADAAALPECVATSWVNLVEHGRLAAGESVLIHGGASGIGTIAIQLVRHLGAGMVLATAGDETRCALCRTLGADVAINHRGEDFVDAVALATGGRGVDVVLDVVGGDYIARNVEALAPRGRLVNISYIAGSRATLDFRPVMVKQLVLTGSTLRARSVAEKARIVAQLRRDVWPAVAAGRIRPVLDRTFPLAEAAAAHAYMERGVHAGKIRLLADA
ncbi:NAD(P)H-quinone oxidoreductase [Enterovirga sp. CN4-39]|uniref:NAD(P)H-quinone oxidoreductase n=1 Tax=Enterovirga sp. CN4-39 TaxID=3400910 RepID=UPI003C0FC31F